MHKKCSTCGTIKPLVDFHNHPKSKDGRAGRCKPCAIAAAKAAYERLKRERNPDIDLVREQRARLEAARAAGAKHYMPLIPCPAGHLGPRFTGSQCCKDCGRERRRVGTDEKARSEKKKSAVKRKTAQQLGQTHYQGQPCKKGHNGLRLASTRQCVECLAARTQPRPAAATPESHRRRLARRRTRASRARQNAYQAKVLRRRPEYLLTRFMYESIRRILQSVGAKKGGRTIDLLGYTRQQLMHHIEGLFRPGMSWENYGEWHIDHIRDISSLLADGVTEPSIINALPNLQPLWALENMSKGGLRRRRVAPPPS